MKQMYLKSVLTALLMWCSAVGWAQNFSVDGINYNLRGNVAAAVIKGGDYTGEVVIPETVVYEGESYPVYRIEDSAFEYCELTSVEIPASVNSIGVFAFRKCNNLSTVISHAKEACKLAPDAFFGISDDAVLIYPEGSDYLSWGIYFSNFDRYIDGETCWVVDDAGNAIVSSYGTYNIDGSADHFRPYNGSKTIKKLTVLSNFDYGPSQGLNTPDVEEVVLKGSIGFKDDNGTFSGCTKLKKASIFVSVPNNEFLGCTSLEEVLFDEIGSIGNSAFQACGSLKKIKLPSSLSTIGSSAFQGCGVEYIELPIGLASIGSYAFYETPIKYLRVPSFVSRVEGMVGPILIFDGFQAPGYLDHNRVIIWEGAIGFEGCDWRYNYGCDYDDNNKTLYVYGAPVWESLSQFDYSYELREIYGGDVRETEKIVVVPGQQPSGRYASLPNVKEITVIPGGDLFSPEGTNGVFGISPYDDNKKIELFLGCSTTVIPEGIERIDDEAFYHCTGLKDIKLPASLETVGRYAFVGCTGLKTIEISRNVVSIDPDAFMGCNNLETLTVDADNQVYDSRENCNALIETATNKMLIAAKNCVIPQGVTTIGSNAFQSLQYLDVTIPASVTTLEENALAGTCNVYFESPEPATISGDVFGWNAIFVPEAAYDAYCAAEGWSDYSDRIVTKEMGEKSIKATAKEGNSGVLMAVGLNESDRVVKLKVKGTINSYDITMIRDKMPLLSVLDLSEATVVASKKPYYQDYCTGKNSLPGYAFYDIENLVHVILPSHLEELGDYAFAACDKLRCVDASAIQNLNVGSYLFYETPLKEFHVPQILSKVGAYSFYGTQIEELVLPRVEGSLESQCFTESKIKKIVIDSIGGNIQGSLFRGGLIENVQFGTVCGDLQDGAFSYCPYLKSVEFERGPRKIGRGIFNQGANHPVLERFVAGEGTIEVGYEAFDYRYNGYELPLSNLKEVVLPESVEKIDHYAFRNCTALKMSLPKNLKSLGVYAFYRCESLDSIVIPRGVTEIPYKAFDQCMLQSVTFHDGVTSIGDEAFGMNCDTLKLPPRLRTIGNEAFSSDMPRIDVLYIPSSVESIGERAFANCKLKEVYVYPIEPVAIPASVFEGSYGTAKLHVPATSVWNYYWGGGWSKFNQKNVKTFNVPYDYFYLNGDYTLDSTTGYIEGTPDADLRAGSALVVGDWEMGYAKQRSGEQQMQTLGAVTMAYDGVDNSASIIGNESLHIDSLYIKIDVKGGKWYYFGFPFDVPLSKISVQGGSEYSFRHYDGAARAKNGQGGWKNVNSSYLKAAQGYIFQSSADDVLVISKADLQFDSMNRSCALSTYGSENINDASWNMISNPYLSYYDMANLDYSAPITVWDGENYVAVRPGDDDYQFVPFEAFFVQKPEGQDHVVFNANQQLTKSQVLAEQEVRAAAPRMHAVNPERMLVNLVLSNGAREDRTRVVFNGCSSRKYETACDAAKFEGKGVPQIYTLDDDGVRYAINERPMDNGFVAIGYVATQSGTYTIDVARMDAHVVLYDAETNTTHDFENGAYTFQSDQGEFTNRFSLGVRHDATTGIDQAQMDAAVSGVAGGVEITANVEASIYNAAGVKVAVQHGAGFVELPAGIYIVSIGDNNKKIVVK